MDSAQPVVGLSGGPPPVINASLAGAAALGAYDPIGAIDDAHGQTAGRSAPVYPNVYLNAGESRCDSAPGRGSVPGGHRRPREGTGVPAASSSTAGRRFEPDHRLQMRKAPQDVPGGPLLYPCSPTASRTGAPIACGPTGALGAVAPGTRRSRRRLGRGGGGRGPIWSGVAGREKASRPDWFRRSAVRVSHWVASPHCSGVVRRHGYLQPR